MVRDTEKGDPLPREDEGGRAGRRREPEDVRLSASWALLGRLLQFPFRSSAPTTSTRLPAKAAAAPALLRGPLFIASFNEPRLFGTDLSLAPTSSASCSGGATSGTRTASRFPRSRSRTGAATRPFPRGSVPAPPEGDPDGRDLVPRLQGRVRHLPGLRHPERRGDAAALAELLLEHPGCRSRNYGWFAKQLGAVGYPGTRNGIRPRPSTPYGVSVAKDFPLAVSGWSGGGEWLGSGNTDRFSEYTFGASGDPLTGFPPETSAAGGHHRPRRLRVRFREHLPAPRNYEQAW